MLAIRLVRLIENHSESLSRALIEEIRSSDRTSDFRKIPVAELQQAATDVYLHLGEWLLQKTQHEISHRFLAIGATRASEGIRLHQLVWALVLTRDHLWHFLQRDAFADTILELHGELELHTLLSHFFDRAIYYATLGHEEAQHQIEAKGNLARARDLAVAIGLMSAASPTRTLEK